jgi:hypothetical protein
MPNSGDATMARKLNEAIQDNTMMKRDIATLNEQMATADEKVATTENTIAVLSQAPEGYSLPSNLAQVSGLLSQKLAYPLPGRGTRVEPFRE